MTTDLPVWRWRRRARILALGLSIIPSVVLVSMFMIYSSELAKSEHVVDWEQQIALWLAILVVLNAPAIGVLTLEKVAREYVARRETLNKHIRESVDGAYSKAVEGSGASTRAAKTWVADGFKEEEDKRPPKA